MNSFLEAAVQEGFKNIETGDGGPFGAAVVRNGEIVAVGRNMVLVNNDPTAHAEVTAIRNACKVLGRFDLSDCELYTSCEPCPMCLSAIYWARIKRMYYGCTRNDADAIGFSDNDIYDALQDKPNPLELEKVWIDHDDCLRLFQAWTDKKDKQMY